MSKKIVLISIINFLDLFSDESKYAIMKLIALEYIQNFLQETQHVD